SAAPGGLLPHPGQGRGTALHGRDGNSAALLGWETAGEVPQGTDITLGRVRKCVPRPTTHSRTARSVRLHAAVTGCVPDADAPVSPAGCPSSLSPCAYVLPLRDRQ